MLWAPSPTPASAMPTASTKPALRPHAIFTIIARIDEPDTLNHKFYYREGEKSVRLKEGEVVTATVKIIGDKILGRADFQEL